MKNSALPTEDPFPFAALGHRAVAHRVRGHVVRMTANGGCFVGAALSCVDLLVHLYLRVLRLTPSRLSDPTRDYLLLSKGHAVPALYAVLAELGYLPIERLAHHLSPDDHLYWHPNRAIPGVEFHSGSLGHLLSLGIGIALDIRLASGSNRVFVLLGDGELDEGSIWEGCLVASTLGLDNLVLIVDRNRLQANVETERLSPLEPLAAKFSAFGCDVHCIDGHDLAALERGFDELPRAPGRPTTIICETIRGKGIPSLENRVDRWFASSTPDDVRRLIGELDGAASSVRDGARP